MQRWLSILLGLAAFGLAVAVVVRTMSEHPSATTAGHPQEDARADAPKIVAAANDAGAGKDGGKKPGTGDLDDPFAAVALTDPGAAAPTIPGKFPDGRPVPPLPDGAPKQVKLGIVLLTYAGAQGAPPNARPKKEALELATKLATDAKTDFHAAVIRGDSGSSDDIGRMPRGILEPYLEYTLFTLPVGGISDALETPRGYWIAKRSE